MNKDNIIGLIDQQMILEDYWHRLEESHNISKNRERRNVMYRQAFLVASREFSNLSLAMIGRILNKNHATVLYACRCHETNYKYDKIYRNVFDSMAHDIGSLIESHTDDIETMVEERLSKINIDVYENSLIHMYKTKLEKAEKRYDEQLAAINRDLSIVTKQMKSYKKRAEKLNKEYLRLKNLL